MKLIGKTGSSSYLVDMQEAELLNLIGFHHHGINAAHQKFPDAIAKSGGGGWNSANYSFKLGAEFQISPIFKWANDMIAQEGRIREVIKILGGVTTTLSESAPSTIVPIPKDAEEE